jgi:uncharacterized protein (DUF58 family)
MGRARLKLRPTGLGARFLLLYALLVGVYFVTAYANLFFLLLCFLGALFAVALWATARNLAGVQALVGAPDPVPAGEPARLPVTVTASRRAGVRHVELELRVDGRRLRSDVVPRAGVGSRWECAVPGLPRGVHPIATAALVSAAPLGLFRGRRAAAMETARLVVYPTPLAADALAPGGGEGAEALAGVPADRAQPCAVREYHAGDELRRIHWRASARGAGLQVREWDEASDRGLEVILDLRCADGEAARTRFERMLGRLTGIGLRAFADKQVLTVGTQDQRRVFGEGFGGRDQFLEWTAVLQPLPPDAGAPPRAGPLAVQLHGA